MNDKWAMASLVAFQGFVYMAARAYIEEQDLFIAGVKTLCALSLAVSANRQGEGVTLSKDYAGMCISIVAAAGMMLAVFHRQPGWLSITQCVLTVWHGLRRQVAAKPPTVPLYYWAYAVSSTVPVVAMFFYTKSITNIATQDTAKILRGAISSASVLPSCIYNFTCLINSKKRKCSPLLSSFALMGSMAIMQAIVGAVIFQGMGSDDAGYKANLASNWFLLIPVLMLLLTSVMFAVRFRVDSQTGRGGDSKDTGLLLNQSH